MMNSRQDDAWYSSSSLITYIGYITGPRAEQPAGVRVVEPPPGTRQHQRGNLYAVVELVGEHPDRAAIADRLLTDMQRRYYVSKGSQSQVMVDALQQAQQSLREVNAQSPYYPLQAGLLCAALLNGKLLVAASGPAFALVRVSDKVHMFPSEASAGSSFGVSGSQVEIFRQDVQADDAFFVGGGGWLRRVSLRTLAGIVAYTNAETCSDAADELFDQGGQISLPGLLIVLATNHEPPRPGLPPSGPGSNSPPRPRKPRFGGLPTALGASPPARLPPAVAASAAALPAGSPPVAQAIVHSSSSPSRTAETPVLPPAMSSAQAAPTLQPAAPAPSLPPQPSPNQPSVAPSPEPDVADELDVPDPLSPVDAEAVDATTIGATAGEASAETEAGVNWSEQVGAAASAGLRQAKDFLTRMLPDTSAGAGKPAAAGPAAEPAPAALPMDTGAAKSTAKTTKRAAETVAAADLDPPVMPSPVLDMPPFAPPQPARGARARLFLLIALVIVLLVPAVVAAIFFFEGYDSAAEAAQWTEAAEAQLLGAQAALDLDDKVTARQRLTEAREFLDQAIELDGSNERRDRLDGQIESELQEVLQIVPLYALTEPLIVFPPEARPSRVLVEGEDIYVLDSGRQAIYQFRVDAATGLVQDQAGLVVIQQGNLVDGVPVGSLADMAWLPLIPGYEDRASLLIADRNNNIFRYDQRVEGATRLALGGQNGWGSIGQIETYDTRVYIADEGGSALYRYGPGQFNEIVPDWFAQGTQVNLAGMISLAIDGDVWFLFSNGMILRYRTGEQVPFSPENSIGLAQEPVDMVVTRQELNTIYLVDAGEDRILVYDKEGAYLSQLRAPEGDLLRGLSGLYIDEISNTMYILTQSALFTHPVVQ
jgi:hypothetical protein